MRDGEVVLRRASMEDLEPMWHLIYDDLAWKQFDAPYYPHPSWTLDEFRNGYFQRLLDGRTALVIEVDGALVGTVTAHWIDAATRWLELGITLYSPDSWGKQIGRRALRMWITDLFGRFEIAHVGLTTWSGNPRMISTARSVGMQIEARIPKVRYFDGEYHDSVKLGVLREDWKANT